MSAVLKVPSGLQPLVNGAKAVALSQGTLDSALSHLDTQFPGIKDRLIDEYGEVHGFINIFVNGDDIVYLSELEDPVTGVQGWTAEHSDLFAPYFMQTQAYIFISISPTQKFKIRNTYFSVFIFVFYV